jgi:hypothetical protein
MLNERAFGFERRKCNLVANETRCERHDESKGRDGTTSDDGRAREESTCQKRFSGRMDQRMRTEARLVVVAVPPPKMLRRSTKESNDEFERRENEKMQMTTELLCKCLFVCTLKHLPSQSRPSKNNEMESKIDRKKRKQVKAR